MRVMGLRFCLVLLLLCSYLLGQAQLVDSIQTSLASKARFNAKLVSRNSFVANQRIEVAGACLGVDFGNQVRLGGGYHYLKTPFYKLLSPTNPELLNVQPVQARLFLNYWSYYFEYVFYKTPHWELTLPLEAGIGLSYFRYQDAAGQYHKQNQQVVGIYQGAISAQYRFVRWFGVGADFGFRLMLPDNFNIDVPLRSAIFSAKVLIFYGELYRMAFPNGIRGLDNGRF